MAFTRMPEIVDRYRLPITDASELLLEIAIISVELLKRERCRFCGSDCLELVYTEYSSETLLVKYKCMSCRKEGLIVKHLKL